VNPAVRDTEVGPNDRAADGRDDVEELARRAAARDPEAWSALFEAHYRRVFTFVRYRLNGASEAEDIASQVFEIAYSRADRFDYRGVPIEAWLIGIARNLVRDHIKKIGRRGPEEELVEAIAPSEPAATPTIDLRRDLTQAMAGLTEDQQTVLQLRFLLDKSVEDTAVLMDRSEDAVKNLQRRALAAMQRALAEGGYTGSAGGGA
jgi:RNA polymerase sigma-70 factor (ECF subfamily)